jgi:hypothetical protein
MIESSSADACASLTEPSDTEPSDPEATGVVASGLRAPEVLSCREGSVAY